LVKFAESISEYLFWFRDRTTLRFRRRLWKVLRISPRQLPVQRAALTFSLYVAYLVGAICGAFATDVWALRGMFAPLGLLAIMTVYGAFRPLLRHPEEDW